VVFFPHLFWNRTFGDKWQRFFWDSFYNALLKYYQLHQVWRKFIKYRENKLIVTTYVQNVHHLHKHKHARVLAIGQLHHQSATAPSLATHAADAVAAHQCHECDSDVLRHVNK